MSGVARQIPPFSLGFDCLAPCSNAVARRAKASGFSWIGRYLDNLTIQERGGIFDAGLAIVPVSVAVTHAVLTADLGAHRGAELGREAVALGCPPGVHLFLDLESTMAGSDCAGYINAASEAIAAAGYAAGLYAGMPQPLSGSELYELAPTRYWRGGGAVPEPQCGFCVLQLPPLDQVMFEGQRVDVDIVCCDFKGRTPIGWYPV